MTFAILTIQQIRARFAVPGLNYIVESKPYHIQGRVWTATAITELLRAREL
jgi:hypothetical protein